MRISDWSSDVCSSDLGLELAGEDVDHREHHEDEEQKQRQRRHETRALARDVAPRQRAGPEQQHRQRAPDLAFEMEHAMREIVQKRRERRSEEHTSELQSLMRISYAVFCLKKQKTQTNNTRTHHTHSQNTS